jgi:hypothetical protein
MLDTLLCKLFTTWPLEHFQSKSWLDSGFRIYVAGGEAPYISHPRIWYGHEIYQGDHRHSITLGFGYRRFQWTIWRLGNSVQHNKVAL